METITIVLAALTIVLFLCQLTCGLWIRKKGADEAGKKFHTQLGIANMVAGILTAIFAIIIAAGR